MKLKEEIQIIVHQRDEVVWDKDKTQGIYNRLIQWLQQDAKRINSILNSITTIEPYLSKHRLMEYDNLFMQNIILKIKQKYLHM
jgi:hypothetical protein